jgi:hypothetical protein
VIFYLSFRDGVQCYAGSVLALVVTPSHHSICGIYLNFQLVDVFSWGILALKNSPTNYLPNTLPGALGEGLRESSAYVTDALNGYICDIR